MPELPEVETTRRGILGATVGRRIVAVKLYDRRLRWPVPQSLVEAIGVAVWLVEGAEDAFKITTPRDLAAAELVLAGRLAADDLEQVHAALVALRAERRLPAPAGRAPTESDAGSVDEAVS